MRWLRRLLIFILGIVLLINTITDGFHVIEFTVAIIMIGLLPIDTIIDLMMRPSQDEQQLERLKEVMKAKNNPPTYPNNHTAEPPGHVSQP